MDALAAREAGPAVASAGRPWPHAARIIARPWQRLFRLHGWLTGQEVGRRRWAKTRPMSAMAMTLDSATDLLLNRTTCSPPDGRQAAF